MSNLKIIFLGEDSFSNIVLTSLIKEGYNIPLILSPLYDNIIHKRLELTAKNNNIEYIREKDINSEAVVRKIKNIKPDLLITAHFQKLLKKELINIPSIGCLNLHPSLLPLYRGMSPQHWPIINGDKKTGITVHFIDEGIDTGKILLQKEIELTDNMYVSDLQLIWTKEYQTIMCDAIKLINTLTPLNNIENKAGSYYGKLRLEQCEIKIAKGIRHAYNLIRGVSKPYYGAYLYYENENIIIWRAEIVSDNPETVPGNLTTKKGKQYLSFNDGTLLITKYETRQ
jgi:methionyl-tRNA formyltransferase